jgi:hypothetical protein
MRTLIVIGVFATSASALAGPPGEVAPTPSLQLRGDELQLLAEGEITTDQKVAAAITDVMVGFGVGQAIEGRWRDTGWELALGDAAFGTVFMAGLMAASLPDGPRCHDPSCQGQIHVNPAMIIGLVGLGLVRTGGAIDAVVGANDHNRRVRELRARVSTMSPYLTRSGDGAVAGIDLRF